MPHLTAVIICHNIPLNKTALHAGEKCEKNVIKNIFPIEKTEIMCYNIINVHNYGTSDRHCQGAFLRCTLN